MRRKATDDLQQLADASVSSSSFLSPLLASLSHRHLLAPPKTIATLNLYPDIGLLPRWPGFEEDDDLAGETAAIPERIGGGGLRGSGGGLKKVGTSQELEKMSVKQLGRLKAQGLKVGDLIGRKRREMRARGRQVKGDQQGAGLHDDDEEAVEEHDE